MKLAVATGLLLVAILVVACGGGDERATTVMEPTDTVESPEAAKDQVPTLEATDTPEERGALTEGSPADALLGVDDMPLGWTLETMAGRQTSPAIEPSPCAFRAGEEPVDIAEVNFFGNERGVSVSGQPYLIQVLGAYSQGEAEAFMSALSDAIRSCPKWTRDDIAWSISPMSFPTLGDAAFAFRMSAFEPVLGEHVWIRVYVRRGDIVMLIGEYAFSLSLTADVADVLLDIDQLEAIISRADERLQQSGY